MNSTKIKKALFYLLCFVMMAPFLQKTFSVFYTQPLNGSFKLADTAHLTSANWFSGEYQAKQDRYIEDHIGFREDMVRLNNQLDFSLFDIGHADGVIVGKDGYLFEQGYISAYLGTDFVGKDYIDDQLHKAKYLLDTLNKLNISLMLVYAPGKATSCSEFIPDRYLKNKKDITNYSYYTQKSGEMGLNILDLASYFAKMKDTSRFELFPKCSIHWSSYGFILAADSLIHYIEKLRNIDMPDIIHKKIEFPEVLGNSDYDIGDGLNLIWHIPFKRLAYPVITFENNPAKTKPAVLAIGDSYYKSFYYYGIPENLFIQHGLWYYNKDIENGDAGGVKYVYQLDLKTEIEKQQVIILMATEKNMWRFSSGFINNAFDVYGPKTSVDKQKYYETIIRTDKEWFKTMEQKAAVSKVDLNELIKKEATSQILSEKERAIRFKNNRILFYVNQIKSTPSLLAQVKEKIRNSKMTLEQGILADAKWIYNAENPDPEQQLIDIEEGIRNNKAIMKDEVGKAKANNMTIEDMIKADAKWLYDDAVRKRK